MKRRTGCILSLALVVACSDTAERPDGGAASSNGSSDVETDQRSEGADTSRDSGRFDMGAVDVGSGDAGADDLDAAPGDTDAVPGDTGAADSGADANTDVAATDMSSGSDAAMDVRADSGGPGEYDTTGWDMEQVTINESASVGTPDSYFFDVASGSPLAASITGGGSGTWSVNVFGGMSNHLYCTGSTSCQVMLRPEDTVVVVTAITTDIGSYSLTVDYSGSGLR